MLLNYNGHKSNPSLSFTTKRKPLGLDLDYTALAWMKWNLKQLVLRTHTALYTIWGIIKHPIKRPTQGGVAAKLQPPQTPHN
jgi:hypothetical protein